jgi:hypothetical protein
VTSEGSTSEGSSDGRFDPVAARKRWKQLDDQTRRRILKTARKGRAIPEGQVDGTALGWAWAVLGPPWNRRRPRWTDYVATYVNNAGYRGSYVGNIIRTGGYADQDFIPVVRRTAREVEFVYLSARGPAAPYREPEPGENWKPEWLRRLLWGPRPADASHHQRTD